jgi:hypothetical protein
MYLSGVLVAFAAAMIWERVFYHRNDGGLKSMKEHEWIEDIFISLCSWPAVVFIGIAFYVAIYHKDFFEKITGRKI